MAVDQQKIGKRLAITKERYRVIIEKLWRIIDYRIEYPIQSRRSVNLHNTP